MQEVKKINTLKILFILPELFPETGGGICSYYASLLKIIRSNTDWKITIIQGSAVEVREEDTFWEGITVHYLRQHLFDQYKMKFEHFNVMPEFQSHIASSWAIYDLAQSLDISFDAVITTDWGLAFIPWIINNDVPTIVHLHGSIGQIDYYDPRPGYKLWSELYLKIEMDLLVHAKALVTHSNQNILFWTERLIEKAKFSLIPPILKNDCFDFQTTNDSPKYTGLVVGRIQYWKGVIQLCEAVNLLSENEKLILNILWIGRDTYYEAGRSSMDVFLTKQYPNVWRQIIQPLGPKTHAEIEEIYKIVDFAMVPSTWDMFNIAAIEHLMHSKPLICSAGAGVSDFLKESNDVFIFENTPYNLTIALKSLLKKQKNELREIGKNGYNFAIHQFNNKTTVEKHVILVEQSIRDARTKNRKSLRTTFSWLLPSEKIEHNNFKKTILENWSLKEVTILFLNRLKKKFQ